nr:phosphate/phosphite/phosphonate ABC transporter substrate-binding protein [Desulfobotulus pelophilus]
MLPLHSPEEVMERISPLALYLSVRTGKNIIPVIFRSYGDYETRALSGDIAIGYQNPSVYIRISDVHEPLFVAEDSLGGTRFRGLIITAADSPIQSIEELRGKRIAIVGRTSTGGYLSPRLALMEKGIDPEKDCHIIEATDNTQENVIFSVHMGEVDAGFIRESALHMADTYLPPGRIRILAEGQWIPNYCLSVHRNMPEAVKTAIREAVMAIRPEDPVLKSLHIQGWHPIDDAAYHPIRSLSPP